MDCWPDTRKRIYDYFGAKGHHDFYEKSGVDNFSLWDWPAVEPRYIGPPWPHMESHDVTLGIWGSQPEAYYPMEEDYGNYRWPKVEYLDFTGIRSGCLQAHQYDMVSIGAHVSVGITHHIRVRGYEKAMFDVMDDAFMEDYIGKLREFFVAYLETLFNEAGGAIDVMRTDEDAGGNAALYISPEAWRKWYKPLWKELFEICHRNGSFVWLHSCGYSRPLVQDFIDMGADVLDPIPPYVKDSDPLDMKKTYGASLCLQGGVNQMVALIYGTPEKVRKEVALRMEQMKPGGSYICGSSQVLTDQIPTENLAAFFEAALEMGEY